MASPSTIGELRAAGWQPTTVKQEIRANLIERIRTRQPLLPGIIGYADTVVPEIENALLAGHDIVLLGERGQGKTRIMRAIIDLLNARIPVISGCEIHDRPDRPICARCRRRVAELGDATPIDWITPAARYGEKLATPDVTIADLIGDIDPIRVAEGRHLADEEAIHYGLIPRCNRGIFAINELPDLHEKIQVGLFNLLEERDVQIRGYKVSLPLDVCIIAAANPEDYTSRGRIITPLKDRFGAQIRTHYPRRIEQEVAIVRQESMIAGAAGVQVRVPGFMEEIIAQISHIARRSSDINHHAGVSVRMTIHNMETLVSNALRRSLQLGEPITAPRIADLDHLRAAMKGKLEWEFIEAGEEDQRISTLLESAVQAVFRQRFPRGALDRFVTAFSCGEPLTLTELSPADHYLTFLDRHDQLRGPVERLTGDAPPAVRASAIEFILEGLALGGQIGKQVTDNQVRFGQSP